MTKSATRTYTNRMTIPEFAKALEISEVTAYRLVDEGALGSFRVGRTCYISRAAVEAWLAGKSEATKAPIPFLVRRDVPDEEAAS